MLTLFGPSLRGSNLIAKVGEGRLPRRIQLQRHPRREVRPLRSVEDWLQPECGLPLRLVADCSSDAGTEAKQVHAS